MAFTSVLVLLALLVAVVSAQQGFFNPLGVSGGHGGALTNSLGHPSFSTGIGGSSSSYHPGGYPGGSQYPQGPPGKVATCRANNKAGDKLYLTFRENNAYGFPNGGSPFGLHAFSRNPFQRRGESDTVQVRGLLVKTGAGGGIPSQGSLRGVFAMVVTENGNTGGACLGTGKPYTSRRNSRGGLGRSPYNPFGSILGRGPFGGGNPFFNQYNNGYSHAQGSVISSPLQATAHTASVDGTLDLNIEELYGRSISVCVSPKCAAKTDMCCCIARDAMSVEEFAQYRTHQEALIRAKAQLAAGGNQGGPGSLFTNGVGDLGDDDNGLFVAGGNLGGGGGGGDGNLIF